MEHMYDELGFVNGFSMNAIVLKRWLVRGKGNRGECLCISVFLAVCSRKLQEQSLSQFSRHCFCVIQMV